MIALKIILVGMTVLVLVLPVWAAAIMAKYMDRQMEELKEKKEEEKNRE